MSPLVKKERIFDLFCQAVFFFRSMVIPVYRTGTFSVLFTFVRCSELCAIDVFLINIFLQTLPLYITGGSYLAFFFMISHNFEGAQALSDTTRPSNEGGNKNSFLYKQVPLLIQFMQPLVIDAI